MSDEHEASSPRIRLSTAAKRNKREEVVLVPVELAVAVPA
jgi:hypothetical protein